jgi:predicted nucleic acid-binding protein
LSTVPDLAALPAGTRVFVDTNIFDLHYRGKSATCSAFINRVAGGEVVAYVNTQVLSDLLHKLMLAEAYAKGLISRRQASALKAKLKADRALVARLTDYQTQFENTLAIGLRVLRISQKILVETKTERAAHGLMTGDSLHLGNMNRHPIPLQDIVTYDGDFAHIPRLTVWEPMDVIS